MTTGGPSSDKPAMTGRQKVGMWIAVLGGPALAETYWKHQHQWLWLQDVPPLAAAFISAALCAIGGWLFGRSPGKQFAGMISAALMGFGCTMAFHRMFADEMGVTGGERWLALFYGAVPGLVLGVVWSFLLDRKGRKAVPAAGKTPPL